MFYFDNLDKHILFFIASNPPQVIKLRFISLPPMLPESFNSTLKANLEILEITYFGNSEEPNIFLIYPNTWAAVFDSHFSIP